MGGPSGSIAAESSLFRCSMSTISPRRVHEGEEDSMATAASEDHRLREQISMLGASVRRYRSTHDDAHQSSIDIWVRTDGSNISGIRRTNAFKSERKYAQVRGPGPGGNDTSRWLPLRDRARPGGPVNEGL